MCVPYCHVYLLMQSLCVLLLLICHTLIVLSVCLYWSGSASSSSPPCNGIFHLPLDASYPPIQSAFTDLLPFALPCPTSVSSAVLVPLHSLLYRLLSKLHFSRSRENLHLLLCVCVSHCFVHVFFSPVSRKWKKPILLSVRCVHPPEAPVSIFES